MGNAEDSARGSSPANYLRNFRLLRRLTHGKRSTVETADAPSVLIQRSDHDGECPVCCLPVTVLLESSGCCHMACVSCWVTFVCTEIENFAMSRLTCIGCKKALSAGTVLRVLTIPIGNSAAFGLCMNNPVQLTTIQAHCLKMLSRYEEFLLHSALSDEPDFRWCPNGCGYGVIAHGFQRCPQLYCQRPECNGLSFCYNCQRPWITDPGRPGSSVLTESMHVCHARSMDKSDTDECVAPFFDIRRMHHRDSILMDHPLKSSLGALDTVLPRQNSPTSEHANDVQSIDYPELRSFVDHTPLDDKITLGDGQTDSNPTRTLSEFMINKPVPVGGKIKPCPKCHTFIQKADDGSCNDMVCAICGFNFCWLCLRPNSAGHYLVLDGCSIWGKRRWSTRRRLLVLLAVLLLTPFTLPLLLAIGIPVGTISFVALSCQLVRSRFPTNKHLRWFAVFCTCLGTLIFFPILTVVAAAALTPVVLGFIYLYLPISVLRSIHREKGAPGSPSDELAIYNAV
ncbi:E3 ubiquitin-protein ligase RNF19A [Clonorchis sinensis]|uniref:RBR-type E3 ubiquitin transferase n=1 Tax=Clonorchis sinensis TaxID=79923 RepID=G7YD22_CLOSI|nr:E3 ubiquitin-protein ligase RNF19A [Clonorchis sinensis]